MTLTMNGDHEICPECGGRVVLNRAGRRECYLVADGIEWSCGWTEPPSLFDLADPPS